MALALIACSAAASATELRGLLNSINPYNGYTFPRGGAQVVLLFWNGYAWTPFQVTASGPDGMYYLHNINPGEYYLQVNGVSYPLAVYPQPYQDIPPVLVP